MSKVNFDNQESLDNTEQHILVDWSNFYEDKLIENILECRGLNLREMKNHKIQEEEVKKTMIKFYKLNPYQWSNNDPRGKISFRIYVVEDRNPIYKKHETNKGNRYVNQKMFELKHDLRKKISEKNCLIHATDNIQETKDNLRTLGLYEKLYRQKSFNSLEEIFYCLNKVKNYRWLVLRNYNNLPNEYYAEGHGDIDLLVDDFYKTKTALDADAVKSTNQIEDGGGRVLQNVLIKNEKVRFDFRHLGDNYYHEKWQENILSNRKREKMFYIPDIENYKFSILYHAIVHKKKIADNYNELLLNYFNSNKRFYLKRVLDKYINQHNYKYVKPEPSVGFFPWHYKYRISNRLIILWEKLKKLKREYYIYISRKIKNIFLV